MKFNLRSFVKKAALLAVFVAASVGISQPLTAKAWSYASPAYPEGEEPTEVRNFIGRRTVDGWTMVNYAKASSNWAVSSDNSGITPDSATDYWNENPVVYKYALGSKVFFLDNQNLGIQVNTGTHSYPYVMQAGEEMPVAYWVAANNPLASHNANPGIPEGTDVYNYKGFLFRMNQNERGLPKSPCELNGDSTAWHPVCAICGQEINFNTYASAQAVADMPSLTMKDASFLYSCRVCGGMEQGAGYWHTCKKISTNKYNIAYSKNTKDPGCTGSVSPQVVYYKQNVTTGAAQFDGASVIGDLVARTNAYERIGYDFVEWNTKPDGSGFSVANGQSLEYFYDNEDTETNVEGIATSKNDSAGVYTITLYAQWKPHTSYFKIDANSDAYNGGSTYNGQSVWISDETTYQILSSADGADKGSANNYKPNTYTINESLIQVPSGYTVSFDANDGTAVDSITAQVVFKGYSVIGEWNGFFDSITKKYTFGSENRTTENADTVKLVFEQKDITLPSTSKSGESFIGWYSDTSYKNYVGNAGDSYTPAGNVTLHARFAKMDTNITDVYYKEDASTNSFDNVARDDYGKAVNDYSSPNTDLAVQNAVGAVNLSMSMFEKPGYAMVYKPYWKYSYEADSDPSVANTLWKPFSGLNGSDSKVNDSDYDASFDKGTYTYTVQSSGFYKLNVFGAQGGNYNSYVGGLGGEAYGTFYLQEGDVLTITVGGQDGYNGGGTMTTGGFSCGGGYTKIESANLGTLLIAGGGGGATPTGNGGSGGSTEKNISNTTGETGMAGGGGGYSGGAAGEYITHTHTEDCYVSDAYSPNLWNYPWSIGAEAMYGWSDNKSPYRIGGHVGDTDDSDYGVGSFFLWGGNMYWNLSGSSGSGIPTNGNTKARINLSGDRWGDGTCPVNQYSYVALYNQNKQQIGYCSYYGFKNFNFNSWGGPYTYNSEYSGYVEFNIPTGTTAVYVLTNIWSWGSDDWITDNASLSFSGGSHTACGYTEGQVVSSKPAYGGSNYINTAAVQIGTYVENGLAGQQTGNGKVTITGIALNLLDGSNNTVEMLGVKMPDLVAPDIIQDINWDSRNGKQIVSWTEPKSNGTNYDFIVEMYMFPATGTDIGDRQQISEKVTRTLESAIAGYYYIYDNSSGTDVADYINDVYPTPFYTWSDQHYSDANTDFTQNAYLQVNTDCNYVHIAAVDVAGNIGATYTKEVAKENLCLITFNTNHLDYQLSPGGTVDSGLWTAAGKTTSLLAPGQNAQGGYYRGYYSVDGTDKTGTRGTFDGITIGTSYGGEFPVPTATGCTFVGWNSKADGTGTYYSADGSNIGMSEVDDTVLVLSSATESNVPGQKITLYAIWTDDTTIATPSKTYTKTIWTPENGTLKKIESTVTTSTKEGVWSNSASVLTRGQSQATGAWRLWQYAKYETTTGASVEYYPGGADRNNIQSLEVNNLSTDAVQFMYSGTSAASPDENFHQAEQSLKVAYNLQGTYNVSGKTESRTASDLPNASTMHGKGHTVSSDYTIIKLDKTIPNIYAYNVKQTTLDDFSVADTDGNGVGDVEQAIASGNMLTTFEVWVSDLNNASNGDYTYADDASGLEGAYLYIFDSNDYTTAKIYKLPEVQRIANNKEGSAAIDAKYSINLNLYVDFPTTDKLKFIIYAVDQAGNASNLNDKVYYKENGEIGTPDGPKQGTDEGDQAPEDSWITGELTNFSVKAVAYNDEDEAFNVNPDTGEIYFQTGEIGHLDVWTVGYVEELVFDFGILGDESEEAVKKGNMLEKYALDNKTTADNVTSERIVPHTIGSQIIVNSFYVIDEETGNAVNATAGGSRTIKYNGENISESALVTQLNTKDGVAYAGYFSASKADQKWWNDGTSIRIPTNHTLTPTGDVDKYGTPIYENEVHAFNVIARKDEEEAFTTSSFILWDMTSNDVHYRVIHEN